MPPHPFTVSGPLLQRRVLRYFRRHGLLDEIDAAGMLTWQGSGGFSVDASVRIEAEDGTPFISDGWTREVGAPLEGHGLSRLV